MIALINYLTQEVRMFQLDHKSRKSIYEQIVDNIKELILAGIIKPEEKLPSVRDLSKTLTVNPNTIQKAYRELERQNYAYSVSGVGTFVSTPEDDSIDEELLKEVKNRIAKDIKELYFIGLSKEEVKKVVDDLLKNGGIHD